MAKSEEHISFNRLFLAGSLTVSAIAGMSLEAPKHQNVEEMRQRIKLARTYLADKEIQAAWLEVLRRQVCKVHTTCLG